MVNTCRLPPHSSRPQTGELTGTSNRNHIASVAHGRITTPWIKAGRDVKHENNEFLSSQIRTWLKNKLPQFTHISNPCYTHHQDTSGRGNTLLWLDHQELQSLIVIGIPLQLLQLWFRYVLREVSGRKHSTPEKSTLLTSRVLCLNFL